MDQTPIIQHIRTQTAISARPKHKREKENVKN